MGMGRLLRAHKQFEQHTITITMSPCTHSSEMHTKIAEKPCYCYGPAPLARSPQNLSNEILPGHNIAQDLLTPNITLQHLSNRARAMALRNTWPVNPPPRVSESQSPDMSTEVCPQSIVPTSAL